MKKKYILILLLCYSLPAFAQFQFINTNTLEPLGNLTTIDSLIFISKGRSELITTNDTGKTFVNISFSTIPNYHNTIVTANGKLFLTSFKFSPGNHHLQFFVSDDTGLSWQLRFDTTNFAHEVTIMSDSLHGVMTSLSSAAAQGFHTLRTEDGGHTWINDTINGDYNHASTIHDSCILLGGAFYGGVALSTDYGKNWRTTGMGNNSSVFATKIINKDTIYAISQTTSGVMQFYYSFNGMDTSVINESFNLQIPFYLYGLDVLNKNEIYSCGKASFDGGNTYNGAIMKTTNLGVSWESINTGIPFNSFDKMLGDIIFLNDSIALISGSNGTLIKWNKNSLVTTVININKESNNLQVYPNPASDFITLNYLTDENSKVDVSIIDIFGSTILKQVIEVKVGTNSIPMNIASFASGNYFLRAISKNLLSTIKIVKE